ncbi:unnamed protein product [Urochloa humidicola]
MEEPPPAMVAVLTDDVLIPCILKRLPPVDLVRAALTCHRWRRAAALVLTISRAPPLLGYFVHPKEPRSPPPKARAELPAVFVPRDASCPRLSLPLAPDDAPDVAIHDVHLGLVLLLPGERPEMLLPGILVLDPASRRRALLPLPPRDALPNDERHQTRRIIGAAVLSRAHPSRLAFEAVCITLDEDRPRAWVACVHDDDCIWRALPRSEQAMDQIELLSFDKGCVRDKGKLYWRFCDSRRLLALDSRSLEMSLVLAPAELGCHFNKYGIRKKEETLFGMNNDRPIFPYSLRWPPEFLSTLKGDPLTENIMKLVRIAVYNISYIRSVFEKEYFCDTSTTDTGMTIKQLVPTDEESQRLVDWIDKGVYDALQKKYLRSILFGIFEEGGPVIEEYCLSFNFAEDVTMALQLTGCTESIWTLTSNAESFPSQMWSSACSMVQKLVSLMSTWDQIPGERIIMMKLLYYDDITPLNYEPPFFKCCDDIRKVSYLPQQTVLRDVTQDLASLHTYDVESVVTRNRCLVNMDPLSDSDSEIAKGYFYCITEKKLIFYFDSAASRHMSDSAGHINYGSIRLSPVYHMEGLPYNIISVGQLDNGKNLIYLGENRINIIDTETGSVIGEGMLHHTQNRYIAKNITSFHELSPGKKKRRALQAGAAESELSIKDVSLKEPPTETEKKLVWTLDCFCEDHMTGNKDLLSNSKPMNKTFVTPKGEIQSTEIGDVITDAIVLPDVLYCPAISANLISEARLDRKGYSCTRFAHKCKIQYRETQEVLGMADKDREFIYHVNRFRPFRDQSSKRPREDESVGPSLRRSKKDRPSSTA